MPICALPARTTFGTPKPFLATVVTRLCLDRLKSARAQREAYVGPWLPEPVFDADGLSADAATELADDLSFALMLALDRLSPSQRRKERLVGGEARAVREKELQGNPLARRAPRLEHQRAERRGGRDRRARDGHRGHRLGEAGDVEEERGLSPDLPAPGAAGLRALPSAATDGARRRHALLDHAADLLRIHRL